MKKGSTGNDPGSVIWKNVADPSSTVLMTTRMAMSHPSFRRKSLMGIRPVC